MKNTSTQVDPSAEDDFHRVRRTKPADFKRVPLLEGAEDLIPDFLGSVTDGMGIERHASYFCRLKQREQLRLIHHRTEYLYLIKKGHLKLSMHSAFKISSADETYFFAWRGPGQVIGEMSPISGKAQQIVVEALTDCTLIEIPSKLFIEVARNNAVLFENLVKLLIQKNFDERRRWDIILSNPADLPIVETDGPKRGLHKVAFVLLMLREIRGVHHDGGNEVIKGRVRHEDISAYLGRGRGTITKYMKILEDLNVAKGGEVGDNDAQITIFNLEELKRLAPKPRTTQNTSSGRS